VLREEVLARHFGAGVQVLQTADGDLAVISRRRGHAAAATVPQDLSP
jgi:hypothetical protein